MEIKLKNKAESPEISFIRDYVQGNNALPVLKAPSKLMVDEMSHADNELVIEDKESEDLKGKDCARALWRYYRKKKNRFSCNWSHRRRKQVNEDDGYNRLLSGKEKTKRKEEKDRAQNAERDKKNTFLKTAKDVKFDLGLAESATDEKRIKKIEEDCLSLFQYVQDLKLMKPYEPLDLCHFVGLTWRINEIRCALRELRQSSRISGKRSMSEVTETKSADDIQPKRKFCCRRKKAQRPPCLKPNPKPVPPARKKAKSKEQNLSQTQSEGGLNKQKRGCGGRRKKPKDSESPRFTIPCNAMPMPRPSPNKQKLECQSEVLHPFGQLSPICLCFGQCESQESGGSTKAAYEKLSPKTETNEIKIVKERNESGKTKPIRYAVASNEAYSKKTPLSPGSLNQHAPIEHECIQLEPPSNLKSSKSVVSININLTEESKNDIICKTSKDKQYVALPEIKITPDSENQPKTNPKTADNTKHRKKEEVKKSQPSKMSTEGSSCQCFGNQVPIIKENLLSAIEKIVGIRNDTVFLKFSLLDNDLVHVMISTSAARNLGCLYATEQAAIEAKNADEFRNYVSICITSSSTFLQEVKHMVNFPFEVVDK